MKSFCLFASLFLYTFLPAQTLVKDIYPGTGNSAPIFLGSLEKGVVFAAITPTYGYEIWFSDGSEEGTIMLKDIRAGFNSSFSQSNAVQSGNYIYMVLLDTTISNSGLWRTDGTTQGTQRMMKFSSSFAIPNVSQNEISGVNGKCLFAYGDNNNKDLWVSDGTAAGTRLLKDFKPGQSLGGKPYNLVNMGDYVYFFADDGEHGYELWRSDGTDSGTQIVKDIFPGTVGCISNIAQTTNMLASNNKLYFYAISDVVSGFELFVSDGTDSGTRMVKDLNPLPYSNSSVFVAGTSDSFALVFYRNSGTNYLCRTDGTAAGTYDLMSGADLIPNLPNFRTFVNAGNQVFFMHSTPTSGNELWSSDGSVDGTGMLLDLSPGTGSGFGNTICTYDGRAYFAGTNNFIGRELFVSSGFKGSTRIYLDIFPGINFGNIASIICHDKMLFLSANTNNGKGVELYKLDPSAFLSTVEIQTSNLAIWPNPVSAGHAFKISEDVTSVTLVSSIGQMTTLHSHTDRVFYLPDSIAPGLYLLFIGNTTTKLLIEP